MEAEERLVSQFNEAKFQIIRLHNIWQQIRIYREAGKLEDCRWTLDSAEVELQEDLEKEDEDHSKLKLKEKLKEINENIENAKSKPELYKNLMLKEKFLRKIQDLSGKGAKRMLQDDEGM